MSREMLRSLIDNIDEREIETIFRILVRFVAEDMPLPDEEEAIRETQGEYARGEYVPLEEVFG